MIVLDASAMVEYLLRSSLGHTVVKRVADPDDVIHYPHLLVVEVAQVIRRLQASGELTADRAAQALHDLADVAAIRHPHDELLPRMWQLRDNLTAYDAAYIALAERLGAPLLTSDGRLANAPGHTAVVELLY